MEPQLIKQEVPSIFNEAFQGVLPKPSDEIENQGQEYTQHNPGGDRKEEGEVLSPDEDVPGEAADLLQKGERVPEDEQKPRQGDNYTDNYEEFSH